MRRVKAPSADFVAFVQEQLSGLPGVTVKAMFGGYGLYQETVFFGILFRGCFYLKVDATTQVAFVQRGMQAFSPSPGQVLKSFYEVPVDILEDAEALCAWAKTAIHVAATAPPKRQSPRHRSKVGTSQRV